MKYFVLTGVAIDLGRLMKAVVTDQNPSRGLVTDCVTDSTTSHGRGHQLRVLSPLAFRLLQGFLFATAPNLRR